MKKIISMLAALTLLCTSVVMPAANADNISIKEVNAFADAYTAEWPDREAKSTQVKADGFIFDVYDGYAYLTGFENTDVTEVTIPDKIKDADVVGLYGHPFGMCHKLESITLPDTLKYFTWLDLTIPTTKAGSNEEAVPTVKEVKISETNPNFTLKDGVLFSKDLKTLIGCPPALQYSPAKLPKETETIGLFAFVGNTKIEKAVIPETVKTITMRAFSGCSNLKSVELPKNVTEVQADTFSYCPLLSEVKFNGKIEGIGCAAFAGCKSLTKLNIPDSVKYIGYDAFEDAGCVENADDVYYVGKWCVGGDADKLTKVVLRENTVGIAEMSFILANRITEFSFPHTVKYMGRLCYQASKGELSVIRCHGSAIPEEGLAGVKKLKDIYIYDSDCDISDSEKTIPAKWKYTKDNTDYDARIKDKEEQKKTSSSNSASKSVHVAVNTQLIDLDEDNNNVIPDSEPYVNTPEIAASETAETETAEPVEGDTVIHGYEGSTAEAYAKKYNRPFEVIGQLKFRRDAEYEKFTEGDFEYLTDGQYAWLNECVNKDIKEAVIPEKANGMCVVGVVIDNEENIFKDCTKLEKLSLNQHIDPCELAYMGTEDSPLTAYDIAPENDAPYKAVDGVVYSISGKGLLQVPNGIKGEFVIPDDVEVITSSAFKNCRNITSVKMSKNLKKIGNIAFRNCSGLEAVNLPDGLTEIGSYAFLGCDKLKSVTLPDSVTSIGEEAFPESLVTDTVNGISYIGKWAVSSKQKDLPDIVILKDGTEGIASWALFLNENSTLVIPASVKNVSAEPYVYNRCSNTIKIYGSKAENYLLTNNAIKDVYFYDPECDFSDCNINSRYIDLIDEAKSEDTVIHGYSDSTAEKYANEHNMKFEPIEKEHIHAPETTLKIEKARVQKIAKNENGFEITIKGFNPFTVAAKSDIYDGLDKHPLHVGDVVSGVLKIKSDDIIATAIDLNTDSYGGDANCDSEVNMSDAVLIMQALANPNKYGENGSDKNHLTSAGKENADIEGDEDGMTNLDALAIQKRLLGLE